MSVMSMVFQPRMFSPRTSRRAIVTLSAYVSSKTGMMSSGRMAMVVGSIVAVIVLATARKRANDRGTSASASAAKMGNSSIVTVEEIKLIIFVIVVVMMYFLSMIEVERTESASRSTL